MKKFHKKSIWRPATVHLKHLCLVLRNLDFSERAAQFPNLKLRKSKGTQTCLLGPKNSALFTWRTCWDFLACDQNRSTSDENTKTLRDMSLRPSLRWLSDILERLNDLQQSGIKRSQLESPGRYGSLGPLFWGFKKQDFRTLKKHLMGRKNSLLPMLVGMCEDALVPNHPCSMLVCHPNHWGEFWRALHRDHVY